MADWARCRCSVRLVAREGGAELDRCLASVREAGFELVSRVVADRSRVLVFEELRSRLLLRLERLRLREWLSGLALVRERLELERERLVLDITVFFISNTQEITLLRSAWCTRSGFTPYPR